MDVSNGGESGELMRFSSKRRVGSHRLITIGKARVGLVVAILLTGLSIAFLPPKDANAVPLQTGRVKKPVVSVEAIERLLCELGADELATRNRAFDRLFEIGPTVLTTQFRRDPLVAKQIAVRRYLRLVARIQAAYGVQRIRANGLEFSAITDAVWLSPPPEATKLIALGLRISNYSEQPLSIQLINRITFALYDTAGRCIPDSGGRDSIPGWLVQKTSPLSKGETRLVIPPETRLSCSQDGVSLRVEDGCGIYCYNRLRPGKYFVRYSIVGGSSLPLHDGAQEWRGHVATPLVAVELK
jgi:hypothetical protein